MSIHGKRGKPVRKHEQIARQQNWWLIVGGVAGGIFALFVALYAGGMFSAPPAAPMRSAVCGAIQSFPSQGQTHIPPNADHPPYSSNPPTSGWHWDTPQEWGIYATPQVQEQLVHNLEHGGIIVQYKDLTAQDAQRLTELVKRDSSHLILAPYPGLPTETQVALTAWTKLQTCTGVDENVIRAFVNAFRNQGPERVP